MCKRLPREEQSRLMWETLSEELFETEREPSEPKRKRVPLKALIVNGGKVSFDTGGRVDPFAVFRLFDQMLDRRKPTIPISNLSKHAADDLNTFITAQMADTPTP